MFNKSKHQSDKYALFAVLLMGLFFSCAIIEPEKNWNNPFDPDGTNFYPPEVFSHNDTSITTNKTLLIHIDSKDENGSIEGLMWSFNGGVNWDTTMTTEPYQKSWTILDTGFNSVWYCAIDNNGIVSKPDSFNVRVHFNAPLLTAVNDSSIRQDANVALHFQATDTNGTIVKYYWKSPANCASWSDSSETADAIFSKREGGPLDVVWAAVDNDGIIVYDTFTLIFNRKAVSVGLANMPPVFSSFNYDELKGNLNLTLNASDPDGECDTLTYTFFLSKKGSEMQQVYSGKNSHYNVHDCDPITSYSWRLLVKDKFCDSVENSGEFVSPQAPSNPKGTKYIRSKGVFFSMGQSGFASYEQPLHEVTFSNNFWIDTIEITNSEFISILGLTEKSVVNNNLPVIDISWFDAVLYCNARSKSEQRDTVYSYTGINGIAGKKCTLDGLIINMNSTGYRLPTEAEWEFACRGGTGTQYYWGNNLSELDSYAWIKVNSGGILHTAAQKKPNAFGLYDMAGNAWEWCNDWYDSNYYAASPKENPSGPASGQERSIRGGSWMHTDYFAQSGSRCKLQPQTGNESVGFRVVLPVR